MSKNLFRKVLALGSAVALGAGLLVASPASATVPTQNALFPAGINVGTTASPVTGTSAKVLAGTDVNISATRGAGFNFYAPTYATFNQFDQDNLGSTSTTVFTGTGTAVSFGVSAGTLTVTRAGLTGLASGDRVRFQATVADDSCYGTDGNDTSRSFDLYGDVVTVGAGDITVNVQSTNAATCSTPSTITLTRLETTNALDYTGNEDWFATSDIQWHSSSAAISVDVVSANASAVAYVGASGITAETTATITPYITQGAATGIGNAVLLGRPVTVTFVPYVESEWTTVLSINDPISADPSVFDLQAFLRPLAGSTGWTFIQMNDDLRFQVLRDGLDYETDQTLNDSSSALGRLWTGVPRGVYTARAFIESTQAAGVSADRFVGALSAPATTTFLFTEAAVTGIVLNEQASANVTTDGKVRTGTKDLTVSATVMKSSTSALAKAGVEVRWVVSVTNPTGTTAGFSFNGKAQTASDGNVYVITTTDAKGVARLNVTNSVAAAGNAFSVRAQVGTPAGTGYFTTGATGVYSNADINTPQAYVWTNAVAERIFEAKDLGTAAVLNSTNGGSYTLNYTVSDNFGQPYAGTDLRISSSSFTSVAVVNGRAAVTVNETLFRGATYSVVAKVQKRDSATSTTYSDVDLDSVAGGTQRLETTTNVVVVANAAPSKLDLRATYNSGSSMNVNYNDFDDVNFNLVGTNNTLFVPFASATGSAVTMLSGRVVNANGVLLPGAKVELRGNGQFIAETSSSDVFRQNSIEVYADANGLYTVYFASHKSGKTQITATSGSASVVLEVSVNTPGIDNYDSLEISAPKSIKAGRSITVSVAVVDMWGNPVASDDTEDNTLFATSNRGLIVVANPVEGGSDGSSPDAKPAIYSVKVMLQPLERGPVNMSFIWGDDSNYYLTGSTAVWAGPAVNAVAGAKKGRVVVEAYRAVGQTVNVFVGSTKVASFVPNKANDKFVVKGLKKGNRKVTVKVTPGYDFKGVIAVK